MYKLENWYVTTKNPYAAPEMQVAALNGDVYGHPRFPDGFNVTTSAIVGYKNGCVVTKNGSSYELGQIEAGYEEAYPNAKARFLKSFDENGDLRKKKEKKEENALV